MKVATFNVNSLRSRLSIVLNWLEQQKPDILCLQETKVQDKDFPALSFINVGYKVVFKGEKSYNGVALISKEKATSINFGFDDGQQRDETRLLSAKVGRVNIVNSYVPQGREIEHEMYQYKLNWFKRLRSWFDRHFTPRTPLIWLGDMNVAPEPIDVYHPEKKENHVCYHEGIRKAFARTKEWGFVDIFRKHHPEPRLYSFFDYRIPNAVRYRLGWRIDHILGTGAIAKKSTDAYIDLKPRLGPSPSDHAIVTAEFKI